MTALILTWYSSEGALSEERWSTDRVRGQIGREWEKRRNGDLLYPSPPLQLNLHFQIHHSSLVFHLHSTVLTLLEARGCIQLLVSLSWYQCINDGVFTCIYNLLGRIQSMINELMICYAAVYSFTKWGTVSKRD